MPICLVSDPHVADQIVRIHNVPKCLRAMTVHFPIFGKESLALAASDKKGDCHWRTIRKAIAPGFKKVGITLMICEAILANVENAGPPRAVLD